MMCFAPSEPLAQRGWRLVSPVLALWLALAAGACKDDPVRATDDVAGTWTAVTEDGARQYLRITFEEIEGFSEDLLADCFDRVLYEIVEIDGDEFHITDQTHTFSVRLRRDGDELQVTAFDVALDYVGTAVDPSTLPLCSAPSPGVTCDEPLLLTVPGAFEGSLTGSDPENPDGSHYDLYRIEVEAPVDLVLEMTSTEIDSYLFLFDGEGAVLAQNDDASSRTLNASIAATLEAGCYIVMTTSAVAGHFGAYQVETTTP